jgi:hypothetical protein
MPGAGEQQKEGNENNGEQNPQAAAEGFVVRGSWSLNIDDFAFTNRAYQAPKIS